jgi:hypothetical protein
LHDFRGQPQSDVRFARHAAKDIDGPVGISDLETSPCDQLSAFSSADRWKVSDPAFEDFFPCTAFVVGHPASCQHTAAAEAPRSVSEAHILKVLDRDQCS